MRIPSIMAAVRKANTQALDRIPSAGGRNKTRNIMPVRNLHPNSSPVYKAQSETTLTAGMGNLSISDRMNISSKRSVSGRGSATTTVKSLADAASLLQQGAVKNVVVVAGAGISTPSGIPDFRSPGTGLYDNLQQYQIPYPEAIFDIDYFHQNPRPFFTLAKELYPTGKYRPNYIHYFVKLLYDKGMLLRMYTQNIDGLERISGVPEERLVEAHGTFSTATCTNCRQKYAGVEIKEKIFSDKLPRCKTRGCVGIVKPDIVFFGEDLPRKFYSYMKDMLQTDLVLVMGTSLEVQPFAGIIDTVRWSVPRILFNREAVGPFKYSRRSQDVVAAGDLIHMLQKFAGMVGWTGDMKDLIIKHEGEFRVINNPVTTEKPKTENNKKKVDTNYSNLLWRQNATLNMYRYSNNSDTSSETDTSSDESSTDSSEEEVKNTRRKGVVRGRVSNVNKNGANLKNGFRSNSAKLEDNNKRKLHTESPAQINRSVGNLTGRTVKSDSSMNGTILRRRSANMKYNPDKVPSKIDAHKNNKIEQSDKLERDKVLKKYGINSRAPASTVWKPSDGLTKDKRKQQTKHAGKASVDNNSATESSSNSQGEGQSSQADIGKSVSTSDIHMSEISNMVANIEVKDTHADEQLKELNSIVDIENKCDENVSINKKPGDPVNENICDNIINSITSNDRLTVNNDTVDKQSDNPVNENICVSKNSNNSIDKSQNDNIMNTGSNTSNDRLIVNNEEACFDKKTDNTVNRTIKVDIRRERSRNEISAIKKTQRRASIGHRTEKHKKPPSGAKRKQLGELNTRPYGFGQKPPLRPGIGPFQRTNVRTLNSAIGKSETMLRSGSAELPRINYRHALQPTNRYDARIFGVRRPRESSTEESDTSSENSR